MFLGVLLVLLSLAMAQPLRGQAESPPRPPVIDLSYSVQQTLQKIQQDWLQWIGAYHRSDPAAAEELTESLLESSRSLGMSRLPDLSLAAMVQAQLAARGSDFQRATWALEAAERLDPGRPDAAFAAAQISRLRGSYGTLVTSYLRGYGRVLQEPMARRVWGGNVVLWLLYSLLIAGGLFLSVQMASKGRALLLDLVGLLGRLPSPLAYAVAVAVLLWPALLPSPVLGLALWWSILLWGYGSMTERVVFMVLWLVVGVAPLLVSQQSRAVAVTVSQAGRALDGVARGRLYGELFVDLVALERELPESPAVTHLLADLHRRLGQWDEARLLYSQVVEAEPANTAARLNLGTYYFRSNDFSTATSHFRQATDHNPGSAAAFYNLSQAYNDSYLFEKAEEALAAARRIDNATVNRWIQSSEQQRLVLLDGGLERLAEIRRELLARQRQAVAPAGRVANSVIVALGAALAAVLLHLVRRTFGYREPPTELELPDRLLPRLRRILVPGLYSVELGEGGRAFLTMLLPAALLALPLTRSMGFRAPWGFDPGGSMVWIVVAVGLGLFYLWRVVREWRYRIQSVT